MNMLEVSPKMAEFSKQRGLLGVFPPDSDADGNPLDSLGIFLQFLDGIVSELSKNGSALEIHCGYNANDLLNASATKFGDTYFILINVGIKFRLGPLFSALLSHSQIFMEVGSNIEVDPIIDRSLVLLQTGLDVENFPNPPKDLHRRTLASELAFTAEFLVIQHEMGHIVNGHLDFIAGHGNGVAGLSELGNSAFEKFGGEISQTLEYDADCFAIQAVLNFLLSKGSVAESDGNFSVIRDDLDQSEIGSRIKRIAFASYVYFRIRHEHHDAILGRVPTSELGEIQNCSHPPAFFRNYNTYNMINSVLSRSFRIDESQFQSDIEGGLIEAETAWRLVTESTMDNPLSEIYWKSSDSLLAKYNRIWSSIRPELEKYKMQSGRLAS